MEMEQRVEEVTEEVPDNIAQESATQPPANEEQRLSDKRFASIGELVTEITKHYEKLSVTYDNLQFRAQPQLVDGAVWEFLAGEHVVATCRMRCKNEFKLVKESGEVLLVVFFTDLSFDKPAIDLKLK